MALQVCSFFLKWVGRVLENMQYNDDADNCDNNNIGCKDVDDELDDKSLKQEQGGRCNWSVAFTLFYSLLHFLSTRSFRLIDIFGKVFGEVSKRFIRSFADDPSFS